MGDEKTTSDRLFERYSTYNRRPSYTDPAVRRRVFESFRRILGPMLPADHGARILDIACGEGALLAFLEEAGYENLAGFDISPENVAIARANGLDFVRQQDALELDVLPPAETYDLVLAFDIIEHLPKQSAAGFIEGIRSRLRRNGALVLQTPNMGSIVGCYQRHYDLSHEWGLTEKTAVDLMLIAGFGADRIEVRPSWNATTLLGKLREIYLRIVHRMLFLAEDSSRPRIPTKNLVIRAWQGPA